MGVVFVEGSAAIEASNQISSRWFSPSRRFVYSMTRLQSCRKSCRMSPKRRSLKGGSAAWKGTMAGRGDAHQSAKYKA